jgi:hypothetical protein
MRRWVRLVWFVGLAWGWADAEPRSDKRQWPPPQPLGGGRLAPTSAELLVPRRLNSFGATANLRQQILEATTGDTFMLAANTIYAWNGMVFLDTRGGNEKVVSRAASITLQGAGAGSSIIDGGSPTCVQGDNHCGGIFRLNDESCSLVLKDLTITNSAGAVSAAVACALARQPAYLRIADSLTRRPPSAPAAVAAALLRIAVRGGLRVPGHVHRGARRLLGEQVRGTAGGDLHWAECRGDVRRVHLHWEQGGAEHVQFVRQCHYQAPRWNS